MTQGNKVLIIGYGSQAKVWADNLKDSGYSISIGLRANSPSAKIANNNDHKVYFYQEASKILFDAIVILTPDHTHLEIIDSIQDKVHQSTRLIYAHGYSLVAKNIPQKYPNFSHLLLAPKAIASEMRDLYVNKLPIPGVYSNEYSSSEKSDTQYILDFSHALGMTRPPFSVTAREETICDLFSEQSILCSTLPHAMRYSFDRLVEKGISPELAYLECCFETKLIVNTILKKGFKEFFNIISPNALLGAQKALNKINASSYNDSLDELLEEICSEKFFTEIEQTDISSVRKEVLSEWSKSSIDTIHDKLSKSFH